MIKNKNYTGRKKWHWKNKIKIRLIYSFTTDTRNIKIRNKNFRI